jgi:hypothetical protein
VERAINGDAGKALIVSTYIQNGINCSNQETMLRATSIVEKVVGQME